MYRKHDNTYRDSYKPSADNANRTLTLRYGSESLGCCGAARQVVLKPPHREHSHAY